MKTSNIKNNKRLPSFIKSHKIFTKFTSVNKIFPLIGLDNCSESLSQQSSLLNRASELRQHLIQKFSDHTAYFFNVVEARRVARLLTACKASDFTYKGVLIPVPKKLAKQIPSINKKYLDCKYDPYYIRCGWYNTHSNGVYNKKDYELQPNLHVSFSSNDKEGTWDIATMSMRGITSCQSWNGSYKRNLVGSIIDPFLGIIYLTDETKTAKGTKMLKRALVRYVIHKKTRKPALLLERVYYNSSSHGNALALRIFADFLKKKTKNKLPIVTSCRDYTIPNSKIVQAMSTCGQYADARNYCKSYRDSGIRYSRSSKVNFGKIKAF